MGNTIRTLRKSKGYTQEQLAEKLCVPQETISGWERGTLDTLIHRLAALCNLLECRIQDLIPLPGEEARQKN